ncbi:hypothetical protein [Mucilaginibacter conchicola]|nr:hypothetical protein [Mucilaginibacter conchicola]
MKGYVNIPASIPVKNCKYCGARPVVALVDGIRYVVKCPNDDSHYQTKAGVIDIEDWNFHNTSLFDE